LQSWQKPKKTIGAFQQKSTATKSKWRWTTNIQFNLMPQIKVESVLITKVRMLDLYINR
jgi:hypothetical protein